MARTAFGDAFSRSFESTLATHRRERESELAEERLNRRMDRQREQDALDEASRHGVYLPNALNPGGGYNIQTLKSETEKAKKLGLEAQQDAIWEKTKLREQAERDRIAGEKRADTASLVARKYPDIAFDFAGDWEEQIKEHEAMVDFQKRQAISGMTPTPFTQQWHNERTGVYSKEKPPVVYGGPPETGIDLSPEPDKFRTSFEPGQVTPEMEGGLAGFQRKKAITETGESLQRIDDFNQKKIDEEAQREFGGLTPLQMSVFTSLYGAAPTAVTGALKHKIAAAKDLAGKRYDTQDRIDQSNTNYYNSVAQHIPSGAMVTDLATGRPVPFRVRFNPETGTYDRGDIDTVKSYLKVEEGQDSFRNAGKIWKWTAPPAPLSTGGVLNGGGKPDGKGQVIGKVPDFGAGPTGVGISVENPRIKMPEALPPLEGDKTKDFWRGRGVSEHEYQAAKNVFDAPLAEGIYVPDKRYYAAKGYPGGGFVKEIINPTAGGIGDVNPAQESLFDAAMGRLNANDSFLDKRISETIKKSQELKSRQTRSSPNEAASLDIEIKRLRKYWDEDFEARLKLKKLRMNLQESIANKRPQGE